jgi:hypothetical protein
MATAGQVNKGGINPALPTKLGSSVFHSGRAAPVATTTGTDTTPVVTETYIAEVYVDHNFLATGVKLLNGSAVAGNITAILYDANGAPIIQSASTAQSGTAAYQAFAFSATVQLPGPARYFIGIQCNNTGARFRSHPIGNFIAGKKTGETYGTPTAITTSTFTADLGPIADIY